MMSKASLAQSSTAITRLQFLVQMMMENGATVTEALAEALRWGSRPTRGSPGRLREHERLGARPGPAWCPDP